MTASALEERRDLKNTYVTQRTKAVPANTLFGTMLEKADTEAAKIIDTKAYETSQLEQRTQRAKQYDYELPPSMQHGSGRQQTQF